ncbi:hypothetical protein D9756_000242 [Leucocoprinus leucothites]|uniref:Fe2OG dioxygenase domain-containing protein n=1 Tax=Leucocoprinus leucothites TaxID=201217 RepID=A0A8H5GEH4_9AGAR|nr:hypothetical protein D9756_000242 [Leucoagaricus leucothites]
MAVPDVPVYNHAPPTQENLEWADLATVDMSNADTVEGRKALVKQVHDAIKNEGFLYVVNHGFTPEQTKRMFDLANYAIENVNEEEKSHYVGNMREDGSYRGYKPRKFWHIANGVRDEIEQYNMNFRDILNRAHPKPLRPFVAEIDAFTKYAHFRIFNNLLRIIAMSLGLDEERFVKNHDHSAEAETFLRFVKYFPRPEEDEQKSQNVWLKGHTDLVSLTLLFSQPVSALQIMTKDGKWKWVKHVENAIVVNIGDAIEFLSGGYYQSTIHRVRQPPDDQRDYPRVGVIYFVSPHDDVELRPLIESPLVQQMDLTKMRFAGEKIPFMEEYRKSRVMNYGGLQPTRAGVRREVEEENLGGVVVKHYN